MKERKVSKGPALVALMLVIGMMLAVMPAVRSMGEPPGLCGRTDLAFNGVEGPVLYGIVNPIGICVQTATSTESGYLLFPGVLIDKSGDWKLIQQSNNLVVFVMRLDPRVCTYDDVHACIETGETNPNELVPNPLNHLRGGGNVIQKVGALSIMKGHCTAEGEDVHAQAKSGDSVTFKTRWDFEEMGNGNCETWYFRMDTNLDYKSNCDDTSCGDCWGWSDGAGGELGTTYANLGVGVHRGNFHIKCTWKAVSWWDGSGKGSAKATDDGSITVITSAVGAHTQTIEFDFLARNPDNPDQFQVTTTRIAESLGDLSVIVIE